MIPSQMTQASVQIEAGRELSKHVRPLISENRSQPPFAAAPPSERKLTQRLRRTAERFCTAIRRLK